MEVGGVGGGAAHVDALAKPAAIPKSSAPIANSAEPVAASQDTVAGLIQQLLAPQISNLIQDLEARRQELSASPANELLSKAIAATHAGDIPRALSTLTELAHAHPGRIEALASEPGLAPIQSHVDRLVQRLTETAMVDAGKKIESATHLAQTGGHLTSHRVEMNPQNVLAVAERLFDSGKYANVVMSADLAQAVIAYYGPYPVAMPGVGVRLTGKSERERKPVEITPVGARLLTRARLMWQRAPLLLMLMVWMALGLLAGMLTLVMRELSVTLKVTGIFFEVWGLGFLGLIGFGFYRSIRHRRFR